MDVDTDQISGGSSVDENEAQRTPDRDDEETASEDDIDSSGAASPVKPPARNTRSRAGAKSATTKVHAGASSKDARQSNIVNRDQDSPKAPPPRRDLPFGKKKAASAHAPEPSKPLVDAADEETASDDEL